MKILDKHQLKLVHGGDSRSPDLPREQSQECKKEF